MSKDALELLKRVAHQVWEKYDDTFGYRSDKQERNESVSTDISDNVWFFWGQFDGENQGELVRRIQEEPEDTEGRDEALIWFSKVGITGL